MPATKTSQDSPRSSVKIRTRKRAEGRLGQLTACYSGFGTSLASPCELFLLSRYTFSLSFDEPCGGVCGGLFLCHDRERETRPTGGHCGDPLVMPIWKSTLEVGLEFE